VNDRDNLTRDPARRAIIGKRTLERSAAGPRTITRFETEIPPYCPAKKKRDVALRWGPWDRATLAVQTLFTSQHVPGTLKRGYPPPA
jgi:hypothetical protein